MRAPSLNPSGRRDFQIFRIGALQSANESSSDLTREERVFSVGFLAPAPAGVADDVDVR